MTKHERRLALALGSCTFIPGHPHKRFCRNMAGIAVYSPDKEISLRQRHYMEIMAWRYRRQLPSDLVPPGKPLDLPIPVPLPKTLKRRKQSGEAPIAVLEAVCEQLSLPGFANGADVP